MQNGAHVRLERPSLFPRRRRSGSTLAAGARAAGQPDHRRAPHRRARGGARRRCSSARPAGYALTPAGEALLDQARAVEAAATGFAEAAAAHARDVSGTVRLTTEEIFANTLLGPMLRELHDLHPGSDRARHRARASATSAPARPTSRCAAPPCRSPPASSAAACASTIGRSTAAATMPRATASPRPSRN